MKKYLLTLLFIGLWYGISLAHGDTSDPSVHTELPSGYFQLPIWVLVTIVGLLTTFIGYIWHKMDVAVEKLAEIVKGLGEGSVKREDAIKYINGRLDNIEANAARKDDLHKILNENFGKAEQQLQITTGRLTRLETAWDEAAREELSKGGYVTMDKMNEIIQKMTENLTKLISDKLESAEKNLSLQMENMRLSLLANAKKIPIRRSKVHDEE